MKVDAYHQGQPCWIELASHDSEGAKSFYMSLFGWQANDMPTPEGVYSMVHFDGDDVGAIYQMPQQMQDEGTPSHWTLYFAVDDVDTVVSSVKLAGGKVIAGPHNVGEAGRMALLSDQEGARFAIWQAHQHIGIQRAQEHGTLCWTELASREPQRSKQFYPQVIGWGHQSAPSAGFEYTHWQLPDTLQDVGGLLTMTEEWGDIPAHWMAYFLVDNCDHAAETITTLGGSICVPPTDIANVGRFSVANDPQGGVFSIIALTETAST